MTDIYELVENILNPFFGDEVHNEMPEFAKGKTPQVFAVYEVNTKPSLCAEGEPLYETFWVAVNIFTRKRNTELYSTVRKAFMDNDFIYKGGGDTGTDKIYPYIPHYVMDFQKDFEFN